MENESPKLLKCRTKDLIENSILELVTQQSLDELHRELVNNLENEHFNNLKDIYAYFLSSLLFNKLNHLSKLSVDTDHDKLSERIIPLVRKIIGNVWSYILKSCILKQLTYTYTLKLINELQKLSEVSNDKQLEYLLDLRCSLHNLLIECYVKNRYRIAIKESEIGDLVPEDLIISIQKQLCDEDIKIISLAYQLVNNYTAEDLDTFLYIFTDYKFDDNDPTDLINKFLKSEENDPEVDRAIEKLINDAKKRRKIQHNELSKKKEETIITLTKKTIKTFNETFPSNTATMLREEWGKFCERIAQAILLKYDVIYCMNAYLNPKIVKSGGIPNEVDGIALLDHGDKLLFIDVTFGQDLSDKVRKYGKLLEKLREHDVDMVAWIIRSMHVEFNESLPENLEIVTLSEFERCCKA
ncbi:MAG: hypothetical protein QXI11_03585 [Thermoproteota archaeon]